MPSFFILKFVQLLVALPKMNHDIFKIIPSVNVLLELPEIISLIEEFSRKTVLEFIRKKLDEIRKIEPSHKIDDLFITNGDKYSFSIQGFISYIAESLKKSIPKTHEHAINATGVILHTCLGRAPLSKNAAESTGKISGGYTTLEIDKESGKRMSRYRHIQSLITTLTGATDSLLVNNNAAAVLLVLDTLASGKEVIISRSQQVEIGGSFRMPDVMKKSRSLLVEVGTTNRTNIADYRDAISENTGLILIVHPSNYRIIGFTSFPDIKEIAALGGEYNIPTFYDLGSGAMVDLRKLNIPHEPTVQESVDAGIDVVSYSTDKLLGGPQGGLIIGKKQYIDLLKKNPLLRALRVDKMTIEALDATLRLYINDEKALNAIPILKMMYTSMEEIERRIIRFKDKIVESTGSFFNLNIVDGFSEIGGGSCPAAPISTRLLLLSSKEISANGISKALRLNTPPIFGRIEKETTHLDFRTIIYDHEEDEIANALINISKKGKQTP